VNKYRVDVVTDETPEGQVLHSEHFKARTDDAACKKALGLRLVKAHVRNPEISYGELWMVWRADR
jgi:hypothetical protein